MGAFAQLLLLVWLFFHRAYSYNVSNLITIKLSGKDRTIPIIKVLFCLWYNYVVCICPGHIRIGRTQERFSMYYYRTHHLILAERSIDYNNLQM